SRLQHVLVETGALAEVERLIAELTAQAIDAIDAADIVPEARDELIEPARFVASRDAWGPAGLPQTVANGSVQAARGTTRTPGSSATASSHGGRATATTAMAVSRPDSVAAWRA